MAPLILHNVPDDELYVGDDGVQRPYAMVFPHQDDHASSKRSRRAAAETGSFGKSSRRSRSKTATPRPREDPTIAAADKVFSNWFQDQAKANNEEETTPPNQRRKAQLQDEEEAAPTKRFASTATKEPTEIILRGYKNALQQYAAIDRYEQVAGRICEDYPRDPPVENRRYKSELRDPAYTRRRALTPEERAKVNRADGGEHWVKVTFESADAADLAISASPLSIHGYRVYAEPYHGIPPTRDEPILDGAGGTDSRLSSPTKSRRQSYQTIASWGTRRRFSGFEDGSPTSSRTVDTATLTNDSATLSSGTLRGDNGSHIDSLFNQSPIEADEEAELRNQFSRVIPTARKVKLLPAEQALLPQRSTWQWLLSIIPILNWFSGSMIGDEVPRTETGEFDWDRASLYWKLICWFDMWFGLFGGEILHADKDE